MTDSPATPIVLALGSNLGDRAAHLQDAVARLRDAGVGIERLSAQYSTAPVGGPPQGWFRNAVLRGSFEGSAPELLAACLAVERVLGRIRSEKNGPRTIDIDILFYGDAVIDRPSLRIPHPRLHERRFVLVPLAEVAPEWIHPVSRWSVARILEECEDVSEVGPAEPWPAPVSR